MSKQQDREARRVPRVSTPSKDRVCAEGVGATAGRSYCGRSDAPRVTDWRRVRCADCKAAKRADEAAKGKRDV